MPWTSTKFMGYPPENSMNARSYRSDPMSTAHDWRPMTLFTRHHSPHRVGGPNGDALVASRRRRSRARRDERATDEGIGRQHTPSGGWGVEQIVPRARYGDRRAMR